MQINISGLHVEITPSLREYVNHKLEKIEHRFSKISSVHVTLIVNGKKYQKKAEAEVNLAPRATIFASCESTDMYEAIDLLAEKITRQVVKHKEKLNDHNNGEGDDLI